MPEVDLEARTTTANSFDAVKSLDPTDWKDFRQQAHRMMDDMLDSLEHVRERPVWQPMDAQQRGRFHTPIPRRSTDLSLVHEEFMEDVLPFTATNVHPGFMGWVQGGGTPTGMLAAMLSAGLNANVGGRDHAPVEVEQQVVHWMREIFRFPETASGLFVTGTSMANLIATVIARDTAMGFDVRKTGIAASGKRLVAYASKSVHCCLSKAMDISGLGSDSLRLIQTDARYRMDSVALEEAMERDLQDGLQPFMVIGTAGTTDTGAIDDLEQLAEICRRKKVWFHVDGAYGALAMLSSRLAPLLQGIEKADSLAFDFHKWGQTPYDAGFLLVREGMLHRQAFAASGAYLQREPRGMAAGSTWPCDLGPDLSRGFNALKAWFTLKVYGVEALGESISHTCELAQYLKARVEASPELELMAPVGLNVVCFRYCTQSGDKAADGLNQLNRHIVFELQESGSVAPSMTTLNGLTCIRAAIVNHRTTQLDIDNLIEQTLAFGSALQNGDFSAW